MRYRRPAQRTGSFRWTVHGHIQAQQFKAFQRGFEAVPLLYGTADTLDKEYDTSLGQEGHFLFNLQNGVGVFYMQKQADFYVILRASCNKKVPQW